MTAMWDPTFLRELSPELTTMLLLSFDSVGFLYFMACCGSVYVLGSGLIASLPCCMARSLTIFFRVNVLAYVYGTIRIYISAFTLASILCGDRSILLSVFC